MIVYINGRMNFAAEMNFANGWSITITHLDCGHNQIIIVPRWFVELDDKARLQAMRSKGEYNYETMIERGDFIEHVNTDEEVLTIIIGVAKRDDAPVYEKASTMLDKLIRSRNNKS